VGYERRTKRNNKGGEKMITLLLKSFTIIMVVALVLAFLMLIKVGIGDGKNKKEGV